MIDKTKLLLTALAVGGVTTGTWALIGGGYDLTWNTIDGGGGLSSTGGGFDLSGTIGQPDAGSMSGGVYTLDGGFWPGVAVVSIVQWRSVRNHVLGVPQRSIVLDSIASGNGLTGPTVECRNGGIQRIEVDFSSPVAIANAALITVTGRTTSPAGVLGAPVSYAPTSVSTAPPATVVLTFAAAPSAGFLPDQTCYTSTIPPAAVTPPISGDTDVMVRALAGDATGSGDVNLSDAILTDVNIGAPVTLHIRYDMDLSGEITINDALFAKARVVSPSHKALCP